MKRIKVRYKVIASKYGEAAVASAANTIGAYRVFSLLVNGAIGLFISPDTHKNLLGEDA